VIALSNLADALQAYEEAPRPLSDEERRLLKRMFSDYFEVPAEWKAELKADLERDPPILGKVTLGSSGSGAKLPPESLASAGQFGSSGVGYIQYALTFRAPSGPTIRSEPYRGNNSLQFWADELRFGQANQDITIYRPQANYIDLRVDNVRWGSGADVQWTRQGPEQLSLWTHQLALQKPNPSQVEAPLQLNVGSVLRQVRVGPNNSAGGLGRTLYIDNG
jgi:hypothetical protein